MKELLDYIAKNKYVIICVTIVLIMYALGIVEFLSKLIILLLLIIGAIYLGKKMQDNENFLKNLFNFREFKGFRRYDNVYYYQDNTSKKKE